ncbi:MAG: PAS domain S-box protein [Deltaproteobacteria bacterium]|nr:PAS domain S-box protein [Deltaproteobacteria bacterium]
MPKQTLRQKVEELEKRNKYVSENLLDGIWVINAETLKTEFSIGRGGNRGGYLENELNEMTFIERMLPESQEVALKALAEEKKRFDEGARITREMELQMIHKDGHLNWVEIKAKFMEEDGILKIVGVTKDITERKKREDEKDRLVTELGQALAEKDRLLAENNVLRGLLPICSGCKRIRDEEGKWWPLDAYVKEHTEADLTHTICSDCSDVFYGDLGQK